MSSPAEKKAKKDDIEEKFEDSPDRPFPTMKELHEVIIMVFLQNSCVGPMFLEQVSGFWSMFLGDVSMHAFIVEGAEEWLRYKAYCIQAMDDVSEYEAFWEHSGGHSQAAEPVIDDVKEYYKAALEAHLEKQKGGAAAAASSSPAAKRKRDSE